MNHCFIETADVYLTILGNHVALNGLEEMHMESAANAVEDCSFRKQEGSIYLCAYPPTLPKSHGPCTNIGVAFALSIAHYSPPDVL